MNTLTEQQNRAVTSIDTNVLVSAGAGSGKTHVLVERYLETLKQKPDLTVANIVAVTYTKKAAGEMRSRLKTRIEELVKQATDEDIATRWKVCRQEIDRAKIGTIHSLCESILKAFPADAGIDPQFELLDEFEAAELLNDSIDETFLQLLQGHEEQDLFFNYPIEEIRGWLTQILKSLPQFDEARNVLPDLNIEEMSLHSKALINQVQKQVIADLSTNKICSHVHAYLKEHPVLNAQNKLGDLCQQVVNNLHILLSFHSEDQQVHGDTWHAMREISNVQLKVGGNSPEAKEVKENLKEVRDLVKESIKEIPDELNEQDRTAFERIRSIMHIQECVRKCYEQRKQQEQKLDFNDLISIAYDLLSKTNSPARAYFNENLAAILVDEFQDTNKMQSKLLALLAGSDTRLFLIGDDKQSIYKFQGADVSTFNQWKRYLHQENSANQINDSDIHIEGPCRVETLNKSFRSHKDIVNFVNYVSSKMLANGSSKPNYAASHQSLEVVRDDHEDHKRVECVVFDASDEEGERSSDAALNLELKSMTSWIKEMIELKLPIYDKETKEHRNIGYGDFAVLVQRNRDINTLENSFSEESIPYVTMGGAGFLQKQEVHDLENMLKFLCSSQDSQALLGVLRSPMFAFSDDLLHLMAVDNSQSLWEKLKKAKADSENQIITKAFLMIERFKQMASHASLSDLIRTIISTTNYDTLLMSLPNGKQRSRNLWKLLALANEKPRLSIAEFLSRLDAMRRLGSKIAAAPVDSGNSVRLMTIHSSKGLEFPAVALPLMGVSALNKSGKLLFHSEYGVAFDTTRSEKEDKPAYFRLARILEKDMAIAEKKRLLYVAMTRARDYLGMFIEDGEKSNQSFASWLYQIVLGNSSLESTAAIEKMKIRKTDLKSKLSSVYVDSQESITQNQELSFCSRVDLLEQQTGSFQDITVAWQHLMRKTPKTNKESIEATVIGNYFHLLMEQISKNLAVPDISIMQQIARELGVHHPHLRAQLIDESSGLIEKFWKSELFKLMSKCALRISEPPYLILNNDGTFSNKRPDLLLQDEDKLYVIDYKTDHFESGELNKQANHHARQLATYVTDINDLTGEKPQAAVYFAREGLLHFVSSSPTVT